MKRGATATVDGLTLTLTGLEEKSDTDGYEVLRIGLDVQAGGKREHLGMSLSGREHSAIVRWNGYTIDFRGGSREEVSFVISRP